MLNSFGWYSEIVLTIHLHCSQAQLLDRICFDIPLFFIGKLLQAFLSKD